MKLTCGDVRKKLSEDLQLQENETICARAREHLSHCDACREFRRSLGTTIDCFRAYDSVPPKDLHGLVLQRLRAEGLTTEIRRRDKHEERRQNEDTSHQVNG